VRRSARSSKVHCESRNLSREVWSGSCEASMISRSRTFDRKSRVSFQQRCLPCCCATLSVMSTTSTRVHCDSREFLTLPSQPLSFLLLDEHSPENACSLSLPAFLPLSLTQPLHARISIEVGSLQRRLPWHTFSSDLATRGISIEAVDNGNG
jgi:hypothetical protein